MQNTYEFQSPTFDTMEEAIDALTSVSESAAQAGWYAGSPDEFIGSLAINSYGDAQVFFEASRGGWEYTTRAGLGFGVFRQEYGWRAFVQRPDLYERPPHDSSLRKSAEAAGWQCVAQTVAGTMSEEDTGEPLLWKESLQPAAAGRDADVGDGYTVDMLHGARRVMAASHDDWLSVYDDTDADDETYLEESTLQKIHSQRLLEED